MKHVLAFTPCWMWGIKKKGGGGVRKAKRGKSEEIKARKAIKVNEKSKLRSVGESGMRWNRGLKGNEVFNFVFLWFLLTLDSREFTKLRNTKLIGFHRLSLSSAFLNQRRTAQTGVFYGPKWVLPMQGVAVHLPLKKARSSTSSIPATPFDSFVPSSSTPLNRLPLLDFLDSRDSLAILFPWIAFLFLTPLDPLSLFHSTANSANEAFFVKA